MLNRAILAASLAGTLLFTVGCDNVHTSQSRLTAPALNGDSGYRPARNMADPNAPFEVLATSPRLEHRPEILDVSSVPVCDPMQLHVWESGASVSGTRRSLSYTLSNAGSACRLAGFPAVTLLGPGGTVLGSIKSEEVSENAIEASISQPGNTMLTADNPQETPSEPVLLVPEGRAGFSIGWNSGPDCQPVSQIAIAAPGSERTVLIPRQLTVCGDQILLSQVGPAN